LEKKRRERGDVLDLLCRIMVRKEGGNRRSVFCQMMKSKKRRSLQKKAGSRASALMTQRKTRDFLSSKREKRKTGGIRGRQQAICNSERGRKPSRPSLDRRKKESGAPPALEREGKRGEGAQLLALGGGDK